MTILFLSFFFLLSLGHNNVTRAGPKPAKSASQTSFELFWVKTAPQTGNDWFCFELVLNWSTCGLDWFCTDAPPSTKRPKINLKTQKSKTLQLPVNLVLICLMMAPLLSWMDLSWMTCNLSNRTRPKPPACRVSNESDTIRPDTCRIRWFNVSWERDTS